MGPIEILWLAVVIFFVFVALVRGYPKELGVTTLIFAGLFLITFFFDRFLPEVLEFITKTFNITFSESGLQHFYSSFYSLVFIAIVFAGYAGQTFAFEGTPKTGVDGFFLNLLVGLLNGALIAGTLWYFQDKYGYPIADFKTASGRPIFFTMPLSPLAEKIVPLLPPYVVPPVFWGAMLVFMFIARVRR